MRSRKLLALLFCLITFPAIAGYMTLLGAGVGSIAPVVSWVSTTDPTFPSSSLTYSGPSLSTMFDSTGKLIYKPNNLLTQSNTFSNAAWGKTIGGTGTNPVLTSGQADPLGGTNGWRLQASRGASNTTSDQSMIVNTFSPSFVGNTIQAIWVKSNTGSSQTFNLRDSSTGGTIAFTATTSWQQISAARASAAGTDFQIGTRGGAYGGDQSLDLLIYSGTTSAVTYETTPRTQDQVITTSAAYYGPRIDYTYNGSSWVPAGLLIEGAATNITVQSNDFTGAAWTKLGILSVTKSGTGIDNIANSMNLVTEDAISSPKQMYEGVAPTAITGAVTRQFIIAAGTRRYLQMTVGTFGGGFGVVVDTTNMTIVATGAGASSTYGSSSISQVGSTANYKVIISGTFTASLAPYTAFQAADAATYTAGIVTPSVLSKTWSIGFVQTEAAASASSYTPTGAAAVTRAADVVQFTGPALTALQGTAGTFIVESISESGSSPAAITNIVRGTNSIIYHDTTGKTGTTNGTTALLTAAAPTWNASLRNGLAWSASGRSLAYTGGAVATDANTVSNGGTLYLGSNNGSAVENGWYKSFGIWNQRLDDATFQTKLTVGGSYAANDNGIRYAFADNDNLPIHWRVAL